MLTGIIENSTDLAEVASALREREVVYRVAGETWRLAEVRQAYEKKVRDEIAFEKDRAVSE